MSGVTCPRCGAADGYCPWSCVAEESHARAVRAFEDGLLARWFTVEASKLYARLHYTAEARGL